MEHSIDWNGAGYWILAHVRTVAGTIGVTGFGIGFVKFLRHVPAPKKSSAWAGCLFDTFQDLASNESRIGERRKAGADAVLSEVPHAESHHADAGVAGTA